MKPGVQVDRRRHILHVIDALGFAGAQELLVLLARWTPADAYRMTVCVLQPEASLKDVIESHGARVVCLGRPRPGIMKPHRFLAYFYRNVRDIVSLCRRDRVDVVQCHLSDAEFVGVLAGRLAKVERVLVTLHGPDFLPARRSNLDPRNLLRRLATWILYGRADAVIAVSEEVGAKVRDFAKVDPAKIHTIVNGIDVDSFREMTPRDDLAASLGLAREHRVLLCVGRLTLQKGHVHLLEAMRQVAAGHPSVILLLAGDGELREELSSKCVSMGIGDHVRFLGNRPDVAELLALTDVFVLASLWEGTSLALLEAMAAAKPIVATDIPGNVAVLGAPPCGVLVPPADGDALAEAICHLLDHPEIASGYGKIAAGIVRERFDMRRSVAQLERLWISPA